MATTSTDGVAAASTTADAAATKGGSGVAPATSFNPSGAANQVVPDVDPGHPAVDNDPRANTSALDNAIIFNDPANFGHERVQEQLAVQIKAEVDAAKTKA